MGREKELAKNTTILTIGKLCTQGINFLLFPLYTALLETSDYGTYDLLVTYIALLTPIFGAQIDQGLFRFFVTNRGNKQHQTNYFTSSVVLTSIASFALIIFLGIVSFFFHIPHISILAINVLLTLYISLLMQYARGLGKNLVYAISSFLSASAIVTLNVVFLVILKLRLEGLFLSLTCSNSISLLFLLIALKPWKNFKFNKSNTAINKELLNYSLPLIPNQLSWWIVTVSDRTITTFFLGVGITGIYSIANKFSDFYISMYNIFNLAWTESVVLHIKDSDGDTYVNKTMTTMYFLFSTSVFVIVAAMPFIFPIMINIKYSDAYYHIIILFYAMIFRVIVGLYSAVYIAHKETSQVARTSILGAIINILLNILMITKIGLFAASVSTLVAYALMSIIRIHDIKKRFKICIDSKAFLLSFPMSICLTITYYYNHLIPNIIMLILTILFFAIINRKFIFLLIQEASKKLNKIKLL